MDVRGSWRLVEHHGVFVDQERSGKSPHGRTAGREWRPRRSRSAGCRCRHDPAGWRRAAPVPRRAAARRPAVSPAARHIGSQLAGRETCNGRAGRAILGDRMGRERRSPLVRVLRVGPAGVVSLNAAFGALLERRRSRPRAIAEDCRRPARHGRRRPAIHLFRARGTIVLTGLRRA
jgi:hypothetical protein